MSGNKIGGAKTAKTIKEKYGEDYYKNIGSIGGKVHVPKGFALMTKEEIRKAGAKGGRNSRRGKSVNNQRFNCVYRALLYLSVLRPCLCRTTHRTSGKRFRTKI